MKLLHKRILILFSIALNIGFVVVAISMAVHHSRPYHERSWLDLVAMVERLDLPRDQETAALESIKAFRESADQHDEKIKEARKRVLQLLAAPGPLDRDRLHVLIEAVDHEHGLKRRVFENHVADLRRQLGNEKGAEFFSRLLKHLEDRHRRPKL